MTGVIANPWSALRRLTPAQLAFQLAHAQARDAVHRKLDAGALSTAIEALGLPTLRLHSAAADRPIYLQRPDLGRRLDDASAQRLRALAPAGRVDLALVVADGLSALAVERHAAALIGQLQPLLAQGWRWAPVAIVEQGRVAVGDPIGEALAADLVVVLIGERPGLSSPDSLGIYVTWAPVPGRTDAQRNCISNVRPEGLPLPDAARRLAWLLGEARQRRVSGVDLKDDSPPALAAGGATANFLLG
jgi:ethanolamine ammonia-lyase small subunit